MKSARPALKSRPIRPKAKCTRGRPTPTKSAAKPPKAATPPAADQNPLDDVWVKFKATGDPILRNRLIEAYYPLVRYISERLLSTLPRSIELDDLTSAGLFGLMDAIDGFDMSRGIKFKTYCTMRIRGSILDELRSQDWVPRLVRLKANRIARAWKVLEARIGREPTDYEMAEELKVPMNEYREMTEESNAATIFSLSDKFDDPQEDGGLENSEVIADQKVATPLDALHRRDVIEVLTRNLSQKEKRIIIMYYYEGLTMKEIGRILDLTESRVCQIHSNVIMRLREQAERKVGLSRLRPASATGKRALSGLLALAVMAAVVWVSARSSITIGDRNLMPKGALGNLFHIAAFSCIGWLVARALDKNAESAGLGTTTGKCAFLIATIFGISDEAHQFFTPSRVCSLSDAVLDALAAASALLIPWFGGRGRPRTAIPAAICLAVAVVIAIATGYWRPPGDELLEAALFALGFQRP